MPSERIILLEVRNVSKSFSGVQVLHGVDFDLTPGTVHALVGENGAGKSTLIKILSGVQAMDSGSVTLDGKAVEALSPARAQALGIVTIYQERNLIPDLTVGENILLGAVPVNRLGIVQWSQLFARSQEILDDLHLNLKARDRVARLTAAEQQAVEIAKALYKKARIFIMDEPTASLTGVETENLFRLICRLREQGAAIIYISHHLDEIFQIADEVTVLRDGFRVQHCPIGQISEEELVRAMVGESLTLTQVAECHSGAPLLELEGLSKDGVFQDVNLRLDCGTIIGIAGMLGSGRTNLLRAVAGIEPVTRGRILYQGNALQGLSLPEFIRRGICFVPAERDQSGLILNMSVAGNITLANLDAITRGGLLDLSAERAIAEHYERALAIQAQSVTQEVQYLSGGNRQKVMLSKWLSLDVNVFLLDEPTQGVDVGAREEIHRLMKGLLNDGKSILMVTSDLDELMNMSQLIAVMNGGRIVAMLNAQDTTREEVLSYALGTTGASTRSA